MKNETTKHTYTQIRTRHCTAEVCLWENSMAPPLVGATHHPVCIRCTLAVHTFGETWRQRRLHVLRLLFVSFSLVLCMRHLALPRYSPAHHSALHMTYHTHKATQRWTTTFHVFAKSSMRFFRSFEEGFALVISISAICSYVLFAVNARLWVTRTDDSTIHARWSAGQLALNGETPLFAAVHAESAAAASALPGRVDAVVVPAAFLTPNHDNVSRAYEERLVSGYRYALLSGSPLLVLSGSVEACEVAQQFLLASTRVLPRLFPAGWLSSLSDAVNTTAAALRDALRKGGPTPAVEGTTPLPARHTLREILRAAPLHPDYRRFMSLDARGAVPAGVLDGSLARRAKTDSTTAALAALYATHQREAHSDLNGLDADEAPRVVSYSADPERHVLERAWRVWSPADTLAFPRVVMHKGREFVLPGILVASSDARDESEDAVATAIYDWVRQAAVSLALSTGPSTTSGGYGAVAPRIEPAMRWLNDSRHVVVVVSSSSDQQYVKLLHRQALLRAEKALRASFDRAQRGVRRRQPQQPQVHPPHAGPLNSGESVLRVHFEVLVAPPLVERLEIPRLEPFLLPFTGTLPEDTPRDAGQLARWLGVYSHYIYDNSRRIGESIMSRVSSAAQVDELQLFIDVLRKVDREKLSLSDLLE